MGFFSAEGSGKVDLIRLLLIERIKNDPEAKTQGFSKEMVRGLTSVQVMGSTEAAVVSIIETAHSLAIKGASERQVIERIEAHRSSLGSRTIPSSLDLNGYIHYRVEIEHKGPALSGEHINFCIDAADHFITFLNDKGEASHSVKYAQLQHSSAQLEKIWAVLMEYGNGNINEEQFYEAIEEDFNMWASFFEARKQKHHVGHMMRFINSLED